MKKFSWDIFWIKITSRKFIIALCSFVSGVLTVYGFPENKIATVVGIIMQLMALIGYLVVNVITSDSSAADAPIPLEEVTKLPEEISK